MTATAQPTTDADKGRSRRALLAGALGGIGAFAATAISRVNPVRAEDEAIVVGGEYDTATSVTRIRNQTDSSTVFRVESTANGTALHASSNGATGIVATSGTSYAVQAYSSTGPALMGANDGSDSAATYGWGSSDGTGVLGHSGVGSPPAAKAKTGVYGHAAQDGGSRGVWGRSSSGQGVRGQATSGVGVYGRATSGFAIQAAGRAKFSTSGVATIPAGSTGVTVSPGVNVTSGSFVLLTPKTNVGSRALWFTTNASANTFRIRMSSSRSSNTKVAWLLLG